MSAKRIVWSGAALVFVGWISTLSTITPTITTLVPLLFGNALVLLVACPTCATRFAQMYVWPLLCR